MTNRNMSGCIAQRIDAADFGEASIFACFCVRSAILTVGTIIVRCTLWGSWFDDTIAEWRQFVSMFDRTHATAPLVNDESTFKGANTASRFVDFVAIFNATRFAFAVNVQSSSWWTDTISIDVTNVSFVHTTQRSCEKGMRINYHFRFTRNKKPFHLLKSHWTAALPW